MHSNTARPACALHLGAPCYKGIGRARELRTCWEDKLALVQAVLCQQAGDEVALGDVHLHRVEERILFTHVPKP